MAGVADLPLDVLQLVLNQINAPLHREAGVTWEEAAAHTVLRAALPANRVRNGIMTFDFVSQVCARTDSIAAMAMRANSR